MALGKAFLDPARPPNANSRHKTPASVYIDAYYANLEIEQRWGWERYVRLCTLTKLTPYELASLVGMPHVHIPQYEHDNRIPLEGRRSIALLLTVIEGYFLQELHHDVIANPFPSLSGFPHAQPS